MSNQSPINRNPINRNIINRNPTSRNPTNRNPTNQRGYSILKNFQYNQFLGQDKNDIWRTLNNLDHLDLSISQDNLKDLGYKHQLISAKLLEERMKLYETNCPKQIPSNQFFIIRLDGNNFKKYTKAFCKPYDDNIVKAMIMTANNLLVKFNACTAYTHSDEISLVFRIDNTSKTTNHIYNGRITKLCSVLAGYCSVAFSKIILKFVNDEKSEYSTEQKAFINQSTPFFDARVVLFPKDNDMEITNYFVWRSSMDCYRNCITSYGHHHLGHQKLQGKKINQVIRLLSDAGITLDSIPLVLKQGIYCKKREYTETKTINNEKQETYTRTRLFNFTFKVSYQDKYKDLLLSSLYNDDSRYSSEINTL